MKPPKPSAAKIPETLQQKAKVCATIAEDKTEESLTGESCDKEQNEADAKRWRQKSQTVLKAAAKVRTRSKSSAPTAR